MSGSCPICNNQIEATFGMIQCPQCQSVLFVDFSGNIVVGGAESLTDDSLPIPNENSNPFQQQQDLASSHVKIEQEEEVLGFPWEASAELEEILPHEKEDTDVGDIELEKHEYSEVRFMNSDIPEGNKDSTPQFQSSDSVSSSLPMGSMNYKIQIKGIDSSNLRQSVLSVLRDKRLGLVSDEIAEKIDQGELTIMGLNPVKASVIMNTLKDLPFEISWKVYGKEESSTE